MADFHAILDRNKALNTVNYNGICFVWKGSNGECAPFQGQFTSIQADQFGILASENIRKCTGYLTGFRRTAVLDCQMRAANMNALRYISIITHQSQGLSVQVNGAGIRGVVKGQFISFEQTNALIVAGGINVLPQLDVFLFPFDCVLQFLKGIDGCPFRLRRAGRHAGDGHHCQQHHKHQQDADDATSCVRFCHIISSLFLSGILPGDLTV